MNNFSLRTKLMLGFVIPIILLVIISIAGSGSVDGISSQYATVADVNLPTVTSLEQLKFAGTRLISSANENLLNTMLGVEEAQGAEGEASELEEVEASRELYLDTLESYRKLVENFDPESVEFLAGIESAGQLLLDSSATILTLNPSETPIEEIAAQRVRLEEVEIAFLAAIDAAADEERGQLAASQVSVDEAVKAAGLTSVGITLVAGIISVGAAVLIVRSIVVPLKNLASVASNLKSGKMTARSEINSSDEIGQFAATFNAMADAIEDRDTRLKAQLVETETARQAAERSDQVKSAFLASMSHELRTPLNSVINFTKFVAQGVMGPVNEQQEETLREVVDSAKHLLSLINDVLDMSKIESGSLNLFIEDDVNLSSILNSVVSTGKVLLGDKPIQIEQQTDGTLSSVRADRQRVLQIMLNIMANACKFTEKGFIRIKSYETDREVVIAVEDSGPGIGPEDQRLVFQAFRQTEAGLRQGSGTGLGMPISKSLAEAHGGRLWLESEHGQGTTFYLALPLRAQVVESQVVHKEIA